MKLSWHLKREKRKLNSNSYIITCNFIHNMHRLRVFAHPCYQAAWETCSYSLFTIWPTKDVLFVFIFFSASPVLLLYSVGWVGAVSNMCDICLFLVFDGLTHIFSLINEFLINNLAKNYWKFINLLI